MVSSSVLSSHLLCEVSTNAASSWVLWDPQKGDSEEATHYLLGTYCVLGTVRTVFHFTFY